MDQDMEDEPRELSDLSVSGENQSPDDAGQTNEFPEEIPQRDMRAMRDLALAASQQMKRPNTPPLTEKYHRKTGTIRTPRETSDSEWTSTEDEYGDTDIDVDDEEDDGDEDLQPQDSLQTPDECRLQRSSSPSPSPPPSDTPFSKSPTRTRWVRTSQGKYAINQVKCPPCARRKKADKCRGGPPCGECVSRGRKTAEECQEWGEGWEGEGMDCDE